MLKVEDKWTFVKCQKPLELSGIVAYICRTRLGEHRRSQGIVVLSWRLYKTEKQAHVTIKWLYQSHSVGLSPPQDGPCFNRDFWEGAEEEGAEQRQGGLTCLEWDFGSGGLKKESGSFLILMGTEGGTIVFFGFITALNSASRSVSESPRTWTIWCPAGGLCWLGSIVPKQSRNFKCPKMSRSETHKTSLSQSQTFFFHADEKQEISTKISGRCPGSFWSLTVEHFIFLQSVLAVEISS